MKRIYQLGLAASALLLFMAKNAHSSKRRCDTIELKAKEPFEPFVLLFISDIHRRRIPEWMKNERADVVVIGGDLVEGGVPLERVERNLNILTNIAPVYFIWGNNDREVGVSELEGLFARCGVEMLNNRSVAVAGNPRVKIVGNDYFAYERDGLERAFSGVSEDDTVIFVTHTPFAFDQVRERFAPALLLAGHTHGGQIRLGPFGLYDRGRLRRNKKDTELISNGFGTTHVHLRLGTEGEYHVLRIEPERQK